MKSFAKDPDATLDYTIDWSLYLGTDTIVTAVWTVPLGLTKVAESKTTTATTVWLSGGTAAAEYQVACRITTAAGRIDDRTIAIVMRQK